MPLFAKVQSRFAVLAADVRQVFDLPSRAVVCLRS